MDQNSDLSQVGHSIKTFYSMSEHIRLRPNFKRLNLNSITEREKRTVRWYALSHTELNHREMAYRMIDENVAFMSPSSVYRILKEYNLIGTRLKRCYLDKWNPHEPATAPDRRRAGPAMPRDGRDVPPGDWSRDRRRSPPAPHPRSS